MFLQEQRQCTLQLSDTAGGRELQAPWGGTHELRKAKPLG